jgi:hypothetical protein
VEPPAESHKPTDSPQIAILRQAEIHFGAELRSEFGLSMSPVIRRLAAPVKPESISPELESKVLRSWPFQEQFTVAEFADMLGFPVAALNTIIAKNRTAIKKPFYNISELAERWNISRAQVYTILREAEYKALNIASKNSEERQSWRIPASVVEKVEQSRTERLPEVAA